MKDEGNYSNSFKAIRAAQIVLGAIAIVLSIAIIADPALGIGVLIFLLSITIIVAGIERLAVGVHPHLTKSSRIGNIVLGVIAIGLGILVIVFPLLAALFLVTLLSVGLFFIGIARIIQGIGNKNISRWSRALLVGVGILSLAISFIVIAHPISGIIILTIILAINLLIIGIESIVHGMSSRRGVVTSSSSANHRI
jgi:uncharacterized membrane protein HdeD (DUF308 family)